MNSYRAEAERVIDAPPERVYRAVSDMSEHRNFLPTEFEKLEVIKGGVGEGTIVRTYMKVMGTRFTNTLTVYEPEPGRVLREVDADAGADTTWTFSPVDGGKRCHLKLQSTFRGKPGFAGFIERLFTPAIVRSLYRRELDLLNAYLQRTGK